MAQDDSKRRSASMARAMKQLKTKGLIRSQDGNILELVATARLREYARGEG